MRAVSRLFDSMDDADLTEVLQGHDEDQTGMMEERCILVDAEDRRTGSLSKIECHLGQGHRHRAFSVVLFDLQGRLLIQRRASEKITFPGVWANTCCSHPLDIPGENADPPGGGRCSSLQKTRAGTGYTKDRHLTVEIQ